MTRPQALDAATLDARLADHPGWRLEGGKLHRVFEFADFVTAFGFMSQVAILAEKLDHHPEWSNVYRKVTVDLVTHDAGGVTGLDFELAAHMDRIAGGSAA